MKYGFLTFTIFIILLKKKQSLLHRKRAHTIPNFSCFLFVFTANRMFLFFFGVFYKFIILCNTLKHIHKLNWYIVKRRPSLDPQISFCHRIQSPSTLSVATKAKKSSRKIYFYILFVLYFLLLLLRA